MCQESVCSCTVLSDFIVTDVSKIGECEFHLISELNCQLIVHHPYRTLLDLQVTLNLAQDEVSLSWSIINDSYVTDIPLLFPPHIMAITAISLALVLKPTQSTTSAASIRAAVLSDSHGCSGLTQDAATSTKHGKVQFLANWLAESEVDIKAIKECSQEIISLYEIWEQYSEKTCKEQISRFIKARGLDK